MRKQFLQILGAVAAALMTTPLTVAAVEVSLNPGASTENWNLILGTEFPGAKGSLKIVDGYPVAHWDFSGGGRYIGLEPRLKPPAGIESITFEVLPSAEVPVSMRMIDRNGRAYQTHSRILKEDEAIRLNYPVAGPWANRWGGDESVKIPEQPLRSFYLVVGSGKSATGTMTIRNVTGEYPQPPESKVIGVPFSGRLAACNVEASWNTLPGAEQLILNVESGDEPAELEIRFPAMTRDEVVRYTLSPDRKRQIVYKLPFTDAGGANPRNIYHLRVGIQSGAQRGEVTLQLKGVDSNRSNLGTPKKSGEIPSSRMGTCVHFNYGKDPRGAFRVWHPWEMILDRIADSGYKWIRSGINLRKDESGKLSGVDEYDLNYLNAARERGIESVIIIGMYADESLEEFKERIRLTVEGTRACGVRVYELGNEPANFGGWIKKYGGEWNGRLRNENKHAPWLIAHLDYTNQGAEYLKSLYPEAIVIGCGNATPANFRDLEQGLSPAVDGVVDHPYTFSLPPEKVPFGHGLTERDGVEVGDAEHTFAGLVNSYIEKFKATGKMRSLWVTEFGYSNFCASGDNEKKLYAGFSEEAQAVYLVRRFLESLALPIALSCQYEFVDDYGSKPFQDEANFGLLRTDYTPKPAFFAIQRLNSLMHGAVPDADARVTVTAAPLHRSALRETLVKSWDDAAISAANGVRAYAFSDPAAPEERLLALWSRQPYSREFSNRMVSLEIDNWAEFDAVPVAIDLITGDTYDVALKKQDGKLVLEKFSLRENPMLIKFFKP